MTRTSRTGFLRNTQLTVLAATLAATALSVSGAAWAADSTDTEETTRSARVFTSVSGSGGGQLDWEEYENDPVHFRLRGWTTEEDNPLSTTGTFHVSHTRSDGTPLAEFSGELDCLRVGGDVAVATGVIAESTTPGLPEVDLVGHRVGFTVDDHGRHDRIGWSWAVTGFADVPMCTSTAPFFELDEGGFTVRD